MSEHVGYKRPKTHYHPTEGYAYEYDMTPTTNWELVSKIPLPKGRFFNEEELHKIFIAAHRITHENIELMKKWDKDNGFPDRFKPHHSGFPDWRNNSLANSGGGTEEERKDALDYLTGKISTIDYDYRIFKRAMLKGYEDRDK